ncbi:RNA triphosphatase, putative [Plasmodium gallinaceum]|uniref:mRNA 5'-phosphatase n=1 Tax=Plasmodium gallinaceum TaxID=5849 RepID=A0A1J1GPL4_PLAGA|nr:RNA triphosphatase, putative [Plasmodium gallinaceum]CRG94238.1 RNA triphosphatase, putative [Plasmodium gallinaceum]
MVREAHELLDGSRPIPIDKITYELSQNIILAFDNNENINNNSSQIEIEARVGIVIDKNKNRLKLPINTDAIIENNYSDFKAGVDKEEFEYLLDYLNNITEKKKTNSYNNNENNFSNSKKLIGDLIEGNNNSGSMNTFNNIDDSIYEFVRLKTDKSVDKYYLINSNNTRIRVTTSLNDKENEENESMVKSLYKENINTWNIYLGNHNDYFDDDDEEEHNKNDSVDYRISINIEQTRPISKLYLSKTTPVYERIKERTTFLNKYLGIQLDLTKIETKNNQLYEIEIEIPSKSILKAMSNLRNKNDSNYLHFICSNLVNNVRGICSHLNYLKKSKNILKHTNDTLQNSPLNYNHPSKEKKRFKKYIHDVLPIVGDYMYRVVAKNEKNIKRKMEDNSISNQEKINIFKNLIDIRRQNKKSLKRISENYAENRWKIINKDSKIEIVLQDDEEENGENESNIDIEDNHNNENYDFNSENNFFNNENKDNINNEHNDNSDNENNNFYSKNYNENSNQDNNNSHYKEFYNDT